MVHMPRTATIGMNKHTHIHVCDMCTCMHIWYRYTRVRIDARMCCMEEEFIYKLDSNYVCYYLVMVCLIFNVLCYVMMIMMMVLITIIILCVCVCVYMCAVALERTLLLQLRKKDFHNFLHVVPDLKVWMCLCVCVCVLCVYCCFVWVWYVCVRTGVYNNGDNNNSNISTGY